MVHLIANWQAVKQVAGFQTSRIFKSVYDISVKYWQHEIQVDTATHKGLIQLKCYYTVHITNSKIVLFLVPLTAGQCVLLRKLPQYSVHSIESSHNVNNFPSYIFCFMYWAPTKSA